jgi:hypothetical protein
VTHWRERVEEVEQEDKGLLPLERVLKKKMKDCWVLTQSLKKKIEKLKKKKYFFPLTFFLGFIFRF